MRPSLVFSDFDGTLTRGADLTAEFFELTDLLKKENIPLIIVTGRSISWAHFFLTHFSFLDFVIAEGGGVLVKRGQESDLVNDFLVSNFELDHLENFTTGLLKKFQGLKLSTDSVGRCADRAIDLGEFDRDSELKASVENYMQEEKINFSTSSVHLNFWSGDLSKFHSVKYFQNKYCPKISLDNSIFFGDSLNDQTMFKSMKNSVGVSNISECSDRLEYLPKVVLLGEENEGISGVINYLRGCLK